MVLTNYEMWVTDSTNAQDTARLEFSNTTMLRSRQLNPYKPTQYHNHLCSNGYYGYSHIVSAGEVANCNNDDNNNNCSNNDNQDNNNNTKMLNLMINNDLNNMNNIQTGIPSIAQKSNFLNTVNRDFVSMYNNNTNDNVNMNETQKSCKKRHFILNFNNDDNINNDNRNTKIFNNVNNVNIAKRCRYDNDFSAECCNDFFNLSSTQIVTQSCLMDVEGGLTNQAQSWNSNNHNNYFNNSNNKSDNNNSNDFENLQPQQQQYQSEREDQHFCVVNSDVSLCMSSHLI